MDNSKGTGPVSVETPHVWMKLADGPPVKVFDKDDAIAKHMWLNYTQCDSPDVTAKEEGV